MAEKNKNNKDSQRGKKLCKKRLPWTTKTEGQKDDKIQN
jgi:hypothetical protein